MLITEEILAVLVGVDGPRVVQGHVKFQNHLYRLVLFQNQLLQSGVRHPWIALALNQGASITDTGQRVG